jgi:hypothetical protein
LDVVWSPDDNAIAVVDSTGKLTIINLSNHLLTILAQHDGTLFAVDWAADNSAIAYGGVTSAQDADTLFATVSIAEVERLQATSSYQPEFAITPPRD